MRKVWAVIRREFLERDRNKWFLISTVLGPLFMVGIAVLPSVLMTRPGRVNQIAIVDAASGTLAQRMRTQLARTGRFSSTILVTAPERVTPVSDSLALLARN